MNFRKSLYSSGVQKRADQSRKI